MALGLLDVDVEGDDVEEEDDDDGETFGAGFQRI